jgi:malate dehydrogenase (oxaloacetate-decarboxylating)(NADP+)
MFSTLKVVAADGVTVGPILLGSSAPMHVLNPSATVRRVFNMMALCSAQVGGKTRA